MSLIESLEGRRLLSAAVASTPAPTSGTVDSAAVQARLERLQAFREKLDAARQAIVEKTAGSRSALGTLLSDAREQFKLDRAAIKAARGDADALAAAKADATAHRAKLKTDLKALKAQFKQEIADARGSAAENGTSLKRGLKSFDADWKSDYRDKLEAARDKPEVQKLFADAKAIAADSDVTGDDLKNLADAFRAALGDATAPSEQSVDGLVASLRDAVADDQITVAERAEVEDGARAVLRSANVPDAAIDRIVGVVDGIVDKADVDGADVDVIAGDLRAVLTALDDIFG